MLAAETDKHILIVDRDVACAEPLRQKLSEAGFRVQVFTDGAAAINAVIEQPPHLVMVDWNMPGFVSLELIEGLRRAHNTRKLRLIILSALAAEHDIVTGLSLGADDYITKPFSLREVIARVYAVLRDYSHDAKHPAVCIDGLTLESGTNRVTARGQLITLRGIEYRLLKFLMLHAGCTFNRAQLLSSVWGTDRDIDERTVDVNVQRLRKILSEPGYESYIQTVRGFGYRFAAPATARVE
ncbi:MAG TPA: winged helix-turn-helix domain-containing protein [Steroidobacteraceae bacterium]|nr:winged helix-turn-helix domain-containing protein [Steroidobacteraceae bacterium]